MAESAAELLSSAPADAAPGGQAANTPWFNDVITKDADQDFQAFVKNKNYPSPLEALRGHYSAEKMIGLDKAGRVVALPKDDNDAEGWKSFRSKIGVPETPEGYKLAAPEGGDDGFAKLASSWFHKAGVMPQSANVLAKEWNDYIAAEVQRGQEVDKAKSMADLAQLQTEWGQNFDQKAEFGRRAMRSYGKEAGLDDNDIKSLESSIGTSKMLKLFSKLGEAGSEAGFAGGEATAFSASPAQAQLKINQIIQDRSAGKISDYEWKESSEKEVMRLMAVAASAQGQ